MPSNINESKIPLSCRATIAETLAHAPRRSAFLMDATEWPKDEKCDIGGTNVVVMGREGREVLFY